MPSAQGLPVTGSIAIAQDDGSDRAGTSPTTVRMDRISRSVLGPETPVSREDDRLRPAPHAELVEEIRDVVADGLLADREALADVRIGEALRDQDENFSLA